MNMDFKKRSDKSDWERLNKFLLDRRSQAQSEVANELPLDAANMIMAEHAKIHATPGPNN